MLLNTQSVLYTLSVILASSVSTAARTFTPSDSCQPAGDAFSHAYKVAKCKLMPEIKKGYTIFNCERAGNIHASVIIRPDLNDMEIAITGSAQGLFTLHGKCIKDGAQVAHTDVHIGVPAPFAPHYHAFNRLCDVSKGMQIHLYSYQISMTQLGECVKKPLTPIG